MIPVHFSTNEVRTYIRCAFLVVARMFFFFAWASYPDFLFSEDELVCIV